MKTIVNCRYVVLLALSLATSFSSCKKSDDAASPTITSFSPTHGGANTVVTITGTNLNSSGISVTINGVPATITSATSTQITVTVPAGAGTGLVTLSLNGKNYSGSVFSYEYITTVSSINGIDNSAVFQYPSGVAVDDQGNIFVADLVVNQIMKIDTAGNVTVLAGSGNPLFADGIGTAASFNYPWALVSDGQSTLYVADMYNRRVRKINTTTRAVTTLAGSGTVGFYDGPGITAQFSNLDGICLDAQGDVFVSDLNNYAVRKITPAGVVSTYPNNALSYPSGIVVNTLGEPMVADNIKNQILKLKANSGWEEFGYSSMGGWHDGIASLAYFNKPTGLAYDLHGNIIIADAGNNRIRKLGTDGYVSTVAGDGNYGIMDGTATTSEFKNPLGVAVDKHGNIYVADGFLGKIRKITIQ